MKPLRSENRGVTLVEVLVALVIMSIGLLGIAALLTTSLRNNVDSALRSQASALAADIADRMRANRQAALTGLYNTAFNDAIPATPSSLPDKDKAAWKTSLTQALPNGEGSVAVASNGFAVITVRWGERARKGESTAPVTVTFETRTQI